MSAFNSAFLILLLSLLILLLLLWSDIKSSELPQAHTHSSRLAYRSSEAWSPASRSSPAACAAARCPARIWRSCFQTPWKFHPRQQTAARWQSLSETPLWTFLLSIKRSAQVLLQFRILLNLLPLCAAPLKVLNEAETFFKVPLSVNYCQTLFLT